MCQESLTGSFLLMGPVKTDLGSVYSFKPKDRMKAGDLRSFLERWMYCPADDQMCKAFNDFLEELNEGFQEAPAKFEKLMPLSFYAEDEYVEAGTPILAFPIR